MLLELGGAGPQVLPLVRKPVLQSVVVQRGEESVIVVLVETEGKQREGEEERKCVCTRRESVSTATSTLTHRRSTSTADKQLVKGKQLRANSTYGG